MDWLWIILRYLFPNDPARMAAEAARSGVTMMVKTVFCEEGLAALAHASERIYIEGMVRDYEATLHLAIAVRACQIAGVRFTPGARPLHFPTRAMSLPALLQTHPRAGRPVRRHRAPGAPARGRAQART